ncbi:MAG: hypothetical protein WBM17_08065 [Anaerolineales bacterium]
MYLILLAICLGLHAPATVILTGNYILSAIVILPVPKPEASGQDRNRRLDEARDTHRTSPPAAFRRMTGIAAPSGAGILLRTAVLRVQ